MQKNKKIKIAVIIPAFNEEKNIDKVLSPLSKSNFIDEIICVNDGSTDNTEKIVKKYKNIKFFSYKKNHGKGYAVAYGIQKSKSEIIVLIDADLNGLTEKNIIQLTNPLIKEKFNGVIGYCNHLYIDKMFKPITGERAYFKKDLMPHLEKISQKGYGMELYLNYVFKDKKNKIITLKNVSHALKHEKQSFDIAAKQTVIEITDILTEISKQKNPFAYLVRAYLYSFYLKPKKYKKNQIEKLIKLLKNQIIK